MSLTAISTTILGQWYRRNGREAVLAAYENEDHEELAEYLEEAKDYAESHAERLEQVEDYGLGRISAFAVEQTKGRTEFWTALGYCEGFKEINDSYDTFAEKLTEDDSSDRRYTESTFPT